MDISIIIVNYNTKDLTKQCLLSVFEKTQDIKFEVIVVDNASHDGSQQMIKEDFPNVTLIESCENLGFGRANNLGAKSASGKYLFLLNSDTLLINNAVKILFDFMENNPQCGVCGGNLFDGDGIPARSYAILPGIKENIMTIFHVTIETFNKTELPKEVGYITGADMIIKNDVFKNFHGFDEDFFMYFEETELEFRLAKAGFKIYSIPQANIVHFESKSHNSNENKIRNYMKSRKLYFSKTHSWLYRKITNGLFLTYLITSLLLCVIMRNKNKIRVLSIKLKYFIFKKV